MATIEELQEQGEIVETAVEGNSIKKEVYTYQTEIVDVDRIKYQIDGLRIRKAEQSALFDTEISKLQDILESAGITY